LGRLLRQADGSVRRAMDAELSNPFALRLI
jgi:hypothetical protein